MLNHLAYANNYRYRAAKCRQSAEGTSSSEFSDCYRRLAEHYELLAKLEEDYVARAVANRLTI